MILWHIHQDRRSFGHSDPRWWLCVARIYKSTMICPELMVCHGVRWVATLRRLCSQRTDFDLQNFMGLMGLRENLLKTAYIWWSRPWFPDVSCSSSLQSGANWDFDLQSSPKFQPSIWIQLAHLEMTDLWQLAMLVTWGAQPWDPRKLEEIYIYIYEWGFPEIGVPPNHPFQWHFPL